MRLKTNVTSCCTGYNNSDLIFFNPGLQEVGGEARRGAWPPWDKPHTRPTLLPQLRPDLVWFYEARRRSYENTVIGSFTRSNQGTGSTVKLMGFCRSFQLSLGISHESTPQVFCVVNTNGVPQKQISHLVSSLHCKILFSQLQQLLY
jgi:hypothetical protein